MADDTLPTATDEDVAEATLYNDAVAILRGTVLGQTRVGSRAFREALDTARATLATVPVIDLVEEAASLAALAPALLPNVSATQFRGDLYAARRDVVGRALTPEECDRLSVYAMSVWTSQAECVA